MCGGSPEQGLISAACAQMGNYFDLPTGTAAGMTDSKFPDFQAGSERASTHIIEDVCLNNKAHYLGAEQTLNVMQSEYIYPELSDRESPNDWADMGKPVILEKAIKEKKEILSEYFPNHISDRIDKVLREKFDIQLTRKAIGRKPL